MNTTAPYVLRLYYVPRTCACGEVFQDRISSKFTLCAICAARAFDRQVRKSERPAIRVTAASVLSPERAGVRLAT